MSLVVLLLVVAIGGYVFIDHELGAIPRVHVAGLTAVRAGEPTDVLLVGSDARSCETTAAEARAFGTKTTQTGQRSDTLIVARLFPNGRVEMLSIPRDTYVPIAGTKGSAKINSAFNTGAADLVKTIRQSLHVPINHVAQVNFCGFPAMVDALGGLHMNFPDPVRDAYTGLDVTRTGCQLVDGSEALALVRSRHLYYFSKGSWHYDEMSDFSRIKRQQAFFRALVERVHAAVPDVFRLNAFVGAAARGLEVDDGMSTSDLISLGWRYHGLSQSEVTTSVLPTTEAVVSGQDVLLPAAGPDRHVIEAFLAGDRKTFESALAAPRHATASLATSSVVTGNFAEPWNPVPC